MKKKLLILNTTVMLGLGGTLAIPAAQASTLHNAKNEIHNQQKSVQLQLNKAEQELAAVMEDSAKINAQIKRVDEAISDNNALINKTEKDIASTKSEIEKLQEEMAVIQERIDKRNDILKQRAISYQENNSTIGFLDVLLGATNFADFIERVGAVTKIVQADQDIIAQHDADKKELEEKQATVESKLNGLEELKIELVGMREQMEEQKSQNEELKAQLKKKETEILAIKAELSTKSSDLAAKEREIQRQIQQSLQPQSTGSNATPVSGNSQSIPSKQTVAVSGDKSVAIKAGYKYIGNSVYVFGGGRNAYDIANGRFDCSGFVSWAYSQAGVSLPASTDSLKYSGKQVSLSTIQPGDLVFFDTYKKDGHVGIYIGNGQFIGSQSSTGVGIANFTTGYWKSKFNGRVVRI